MRIEEDSGRGGFEGFRNGEVSETGVVTKTEADMGTEVGSEASEVVVVREAARDEDHEARGDSHEEEGEMDREDGTMETSPLRKRWSTRKRWSERKREKVVMRKSALERLGKKVEDKYEEMKVVEPERAKMSNKEAQFHSLQEKKKNEILEIFGSDSEATRKSTTKKKPQ